MTNFCEPLEMEVAKLKRLVAEWKQNAELESGMRQRFLEQAQRAEDALEHVTELLVDTWGEVMEGDPEQQIAVIDARAALKRS